MQQENLLNSNNRIIGLDAMRAILALFGIVMHSAASYELIVRGLRIPWYIFAGNGNLFFNWLVLWIHAFYMPAFFFISGFLSYKIFKRRHLSGLALSRLTRIAVPFLVIYFSPVIYAIFMGIFIPQTRHLIVSHQILNTLKYTGSFWFLYYLFIMDLAALAVISLKRLFRKNLAKSFTFFKNKKLFNVLTLTILIILPVSLLLNSNDWFVPVKTNIIPDMPVLIYYATFFTLGWVTQHQYQYLVSFSKRFWLPLIFLSILAISGNLYFALHHLESESARKVAVILYSISALTMFLALLGFCLKVFRRYNPIIQYLSDSSYWLYISQIPIVLFLEDMLSNVHIAVFWKFAIVVLSTVTICLLSYQLIIRKRKIFNYIDCRRKNGSLNNETSVSITNAHQTG